MNNIPKFLRRNTACMICSFLIFLAVLYAMNAISGDGKTAAFSETVNGMNYLTETEKLDPSAADEFYRAKIKRISAMEQSKEEKKQLIDDIINDRTDVFSLFKDCLILGDSRALGFSYYKFLNYSQVMAGGGDTILKVREQMDTIVNLNPSYIFLCYGVNDAGRTLWNTGDEYSKDVLAVINELQQALPDAKIYYSSIIWISDGAALKFPPWAKIYEYSDACKAMCDENGIRFIDNSEICAQLKENNMWAGDGVHLSQPFYKLWGRNLLLATLEE